MPSTLRDYSRFVRTQLVPCAIKSLKTAFLEHCNRTLEIDTKEDGTPATRADRDTEKRLRAMIATAYPAHGVAGEEFGVMNGDAEFVWVLDPLDGTKEFLAKESGWGSLIALLHEGKPVLGSIIDPLHDNVWDQDTPPGSGYAAKPLEQAVIATTNPSRMFGGTSYEEGAQTLYGRCKTLRERLNCLGFAYAAEGTIDSAVENDLKLHDLAALLPVLASAGAVCLTLDGTDYTNVTFNPADIGARFGLVTGRDDKLVKTVLNILNGDPS